MLERFRDFFREPALLLDAVETGLVLLVVLGLDISHDRQVLIVAALVAAIGLVKGATTRPFPVAIVVDFGRAALVLAASFGLNASADQIAVAVTFLGTFTTLVMRGQVTPVSDSPAV